jgi:hypothetical protein
MRTEVLAALALAMALPPDTIIVEPEKAKPYPKYPNVPDNFILRNPTIDNRPIRKCYIGERVYVRTNPDEVRAIVNDLRERRRLNQLRKHKATV